MKRGLNLGSLDFVLNMLPYWVFGLVMATVVYTSSHRDLLRIEWGKVLRWAAFVVSLTLFRFAVIKLTASALDIAGLREMVSWIPIWSTLLVPWEDLAHTVPLALLGRWLGDSWWARTIRIFLTIALMVDFGSGHLYQGIFAATMLAFYVPVTLWVGKKYGFGTVMICHVLYDLATVSIIKYLI